MKKLRMWLDSVERSGFFNVLSAFLARRHGLGNCCGTRGVRSTRGVCSNGCLPPMFG
jgi:hypothetical protein